MSMMTLLEKCNNLYRKLKCCHPIDNPLTCNCGRCWGNDFYTTDSYDCLKKLCYYTMNYGPAFASEIYHYLSESRILEQNFNNRRINILSLGCGFSPEVYAIEKYIEDFGLNIEYNYIGLDIEKRWSIIREEGYNRYYEIRDLLDGFTLENYDLVFICKVFSTMRRNNSGQSFIFINNLREQIKRMNEGSYLIFDDVNHVECGRDFFDRNVKDLFTECNYYYFPIERAYSNAYIQISNILNVFDYPENIAVIPSRNVFKTVIFEYRK